jgi:adenylate cyclase
VNSVFRASFEHWFVNSSRGCGDTLELIDGLCGLLNKHGFRIRRCNLATETLHPQMQAIRLLWCNEPVEPGYIDPAVLVRRSTRRLGQAMIDQAYFNASSRDSPQYRDSPFYQIERDGELYSEIRQDQKDFRFPVFADLANLGCRGYFGLRLESLAGYRQTISFATDLAGGYDEDLLADLRWCMKLFTLVLDLRLENEVKTMLARTYLGTEPGQLVLDGMIAPGDVQSLEAAIWFSDLRGFTELGNELTATELVARLNSYFNAVVSAIYEQSGEVLKFIGDAVLAVFPVERLGGAGNACRAALAAARLAGTRLTGANIEHATEGVATMKHGVALHLGTVQFGNVGTLQRLDFTIVGAEVNLASRLEGLCGQLGEEIVCSKAVSRVLDIPMRSLGRHSLKGIAQPVEVFAPPAG